MKHPQVHLLFEDDRTFIQRFAQRLDRAYATFVLKRERTIKFGDGTGTFWHDVEADEVDLAKVEVTESSRGSSSSCAVAWEQWAGIVQRGVPSSLVLFKTKSKKTKRRAPGPGPITKKDWTPTATKWLKGRCVFVHTDGARSYKLGMNRKRKLDGIIHDYVVHKKKKVKGRWVKPHYVQLFRHKMPDGSVVCTKGGTQIIDRCWRSLREQLGSRSAGTNLVAWRHRLRAAQWYYWNRGEDLWEKTGEMLRNLESAP